MKIRKVTVEQKTANNLGNNKTANKNACQLLGQLVIVMYQSWMAVDYRVFSRDVTAAILVSQNNETAAMLVSQTSPVGVQLLSYANVFFCSKKFA